MSGDVAVRLLRAEDAAALTRLYVDNRAYLAPFEPERDDAFFTVSGQRERIAESLEQFEHGRAYPYVIEVGGAVVGRVNVTNVSRGPFLSANLGYWVCASQIGRGVATAAVDEVVRETFGSLGLHRLEAATLLDNLPSQRVLAKAGFTEIGVAPAYLRIAGEWRDHLLFQRVTDEPDPADRR